MRILLWNTAYASGLDGSLRGYAFRSLRMLHTPLRIMEWVRSAIAEVIAEQQPDVCCFLEVRPNMDLGHVLSGYAMQSRNKYGQHSLLRHLPFYRKNCSTVCSKTPVGLSSFDLRNGTKKMVYEVRLQNDVTMFVVHLALSASVRKKQLSELGQRIARREKVIVCGDFNIKTTDELSPLLMQTTLHAPAHPDCTFPTCAPRKSYDLFLCTADIEGMTCRVLSSVHGSDHLPVMLELRD